MILGGTGPGPVDLVPHVWFATVAGVAPHPRGQPGGGHACGGVVGQSFPRGHEVFLLCRGVIHSEVGQLIGPIGLDSPYA